MDPGRASDPGPAFWTKRNWGLAAGVLVSGAFGAFAPGGVAAKVFLLVELQHYGLLAAQVFFGLWLAPLGYLAFKSGLFRNVLGIVLIVAGGCYIVDLLAAFLIADVSKVIHGYIVIPCAVAEIWMVLYLLVIGVRGQTPRVSASVTG